MENYGSFGSKEIDLVIDMKPLLVMKPKGKNMSNFLIYDINQNKIYILK
jgi:hypothetical protein